MLKVNEAGATDGRWKVERINNSIQLFVVDEAEYERSQLEIRDPYEAAICAVDMGSGDNVAERRARLIAAAPEMLAALHEADEALRRSDVMALALDPIYRTRILKAITKAEGRS